MLLKCTMCGGELEVNTSITVGKCQYCDSLITIPNRLGEIGNLYNRANYLRQQNEFDKAIEVYEEILKIDNSDAEAHFGLALSKYGVEYVKDSVTEERIPTLHRLTKLPFIADKDYGAALEYADILSRTVYREEGQRITKIQQLILKKSEFQEVYDIFICYKENDDVGNRTKDSVLAQELYYELSKQYKVFFARKTLEGKIGEEYEPIIFTALNTAKIMLVLGTKAEYFNAVWVRNEWSRFLTLQKSDNNRVIVPCYRDISPYDLPIELAGLQSQDMGKLGFAQELSERLHFLLRKENTLVREKNLVERMGADKLYHNAQTFQRLDKMDKVIALLVELTQEYPDDYRGWVELARISTNDFTYYEKEPSKNYLGYVYGEEVTKYLKNGLIVAKTSAEKAKIVDEIEKYEYMMAKEQEIEKERVRKTSIERKQYIENELLKRHKDKREQAKREIEEIDKKVAILDPKRLQLESDLGSIKRRRNSCADIPISYYVFYITVIILVVTLVGPPLSKLSIDHIWYGIMILPMPILIVLQKKHLKNEEKYRQVTSPIFSMLETVRRELKFLEENLERNKVIKKELEKELFKLNRELEELNNEIFGE
jgi:Tetratricopeptide repeat.